MAYGAAGEEDDRCGGHRLCGSLSYDRRKRRQGFYLEPKRSQVRDALADLEKGWALAQAEYSQIAVELIQMSNFPEKEDQYYSAMASKAEFEVELIRYARGIQGSVFPLGVMNT